MFVLPVAASSSRQEPVVLIEQLKGITNLHGTRFLSSNDTVNLVRRSSGHGVAINFVSPRGDDLVEPLAVGGIARRPAEIAAEARVGCLRRSSEILDGLFPGEPSCEPHGNAARRYGR